MQEIKETRIQSLGPEDPLEEGMATHSSILAWGIPIERRPGRLQCMGSQRVKQDWVTKQSPAQMQTSTYRMDKQGLTV